MTEMLTAPPKKEFQSFHDFPIITDLDNTLWGGVLGEDGLSNIKINGDYPGNCFTDFQKELLNIEKSRKVKNIKIEEIKNIKKNKKTRKTRNKYPSEVSQYCFRLTLARSVIEEIRPGAR